MVSPSTGYEVVTQVIKGIEEFTLNVKYDLTMVPGDPDGAILTVSPSSYEDVAALNSVTLTFGPRHLGTELCGHAPGRAARLAQAKLGSWRTTLPPSSSRAPTPRPRRACRVGGIVLPCTSKR